MGLAELMVKPHAAFTSSEIHQLLEDWGSCDNSKLEAGQVYTWMGVIQTQGDNVALARSFGRSWAQSNGKDFIEVWTPYFGQLTPEEAEVKLPEALEQAAAEYRRAVVGLVVEPLGIFYRTEAPHHSVDQIPLPS